MGVSRAGFHHEAVLEWDSDACQTIRENQKHGVAPVAEWPAVEQVDITTFDFGAFREDIDLLSAGPPCQPWSLGGKHRAHRDHRNLFPEVLRAVRTLKPKAILVENVKGLKRAAFARYFEYIKQQLRFPEVTQKSQESWLDHLARLDRHHATGRHSGLWYRVADRLLNATEHGVPQRRERVFIVAFRSDVHVDWSFPKPSHSPDALLWDQWVTGEYWERHRVAKKARPSPPDTVKARIRQLKELLFKPTDSPWATVRDAIADLPDPEKDPKAECVLNHRFNPGARKYPGHTGSPLDEPAKTLKAGVHGVPGGENTVEYPDGRIRYLTVRESARLQTFPDDYLFHGSWTESMRQLGNAVPVILAQAVATEIKKQLESSVRRASDGGN
jgi:DNA (cytosine-5)-methyltransferase 1